MRKQRSKYVTVGNLEVSIGNFKLDTNTMIVNMGSAKNCSSRALGLCKLCKPQNAKLTWEEYRELPTCDKDECYALAPELRYKGCLPYRDRQEVYWKSHSATEILNDFSTLLEKRKFQGKLFKHTIKYFRFNEAGDFWSQDCINKLNVIAYYLKKFYGIITYGYTARKDLDFSGELHFIVKGSGHSSCPNGRTDALVEPDAGPFTYHAGRKYFNCLNDCSICHKCKKSDLNVMFKIHAG